MVVEDTDNRFFLSFLMSCNELHTKSGMLSFAGKFYLVCKFIICRDSLRKIDGKITEFKKKLDEACGENDYNIYREQVTKSLDKYKK